MHSVFAVASSLVLAVGEFQPAEAAPRVAGVLRIIDILLMLLGGAVFLVMLTMFLRRRQRGWWGTEPRVVRGGAEVILVPMIIYFLAFVLLGPTIRTAIGTPVTEPGMPAGAPQFDLAAVLANNLALLFGGAACWWVGRTHIATATRPFILPAQRWTGHAARGAGGALLAVALCQATLYVTMKLLTWCRPDFAPPEHDVINALRDPGRPIWLPAALWIGVVVVTPVAEELFFRGLLQTALGQLLRNRGLAVVFAAVFFGFAHSAQPQVVPAITVFGVILGLLYERNGSLLAPIVAHALFNAKTLLWEALGAA